MSAANMQPSPEDSLQTRASLLSRLKNWQDADSWQDFANTYERLISATAVRAGLTDSEAKDVLQEVLLSVAKTIDAFKSDPARGTFKGWLLNLTRWRITDQLRKRMRAAAVASFSSETTIGTSTIDKIMDPSDSTLKAIWDAEWESNLMTAAITKVKRQIDPQKYQIFDFYVNKAWTPEQVAATFGVSIGQVYLAKHRITDLIKKEIERLEAQIC